MKKYRSSGKQPCKICKKWFMPNPRLGKRQKTCGKPKCKKKWHSKKCAEWNKNNSVYFKANYLEKKLSALKKSGQNSEDSRKVKINSPPLKPRINLKLPRDYVQEVIGAQLLVIIEYFVQLLLRRI